ITAAIESSIIQATFGQEHLFCITHLINQLHLLSQKLLKNKRETLVSSDDNLKEKEKETSTRSSHKHDNPMATPYVLDFSQDDLRNGSFQFTESQNSPSLQPEPYEVVFSAGDPASMTWCYPHARVLTGVTLNPVPFSLTSATAATEQDSYAVVSYKTSGILI
ncbi:vacuolar protein sorting-associated protein 13B-like, partial [Elysia marginata]